MPSVFHECMHALPPSRRHAAAVQQVRPFGVFVKLDGYRKYGLVHFSQVGSHPLDSAGPLRRATRGTTMWPHAAGSRQRMLHVLR